MPWHIGCEGSQTPGMGALGTGGRGLGSGRLLAGRRPWRMAREAWRAVGEPKAEALFDLPLQIPSQWCFDEERIWSALRRQAAADHATVTPQPRPAGLQHRRQTIARSGYCPAQGKPENRSKDPAQPESAGGSVLGTRRWIRRWRGGNYRQVGCADETVALDTKPDADFSGTLMATARNCRSLGREKFLRNRA